MKRRTLIIGTQKSNRKGPVMGTTATRSVKDPNKSSSNFVWVIVALVAIAALVVGLVVWNSQGKRTESLHGRENTEVNATMAYLPEENTIRYSGEGSENAPVVELYEDFSCPHCASLAAATDAEMLEKIENGELVVNLKPLNFLDRGSDGHSTAALAALLAVANDGDGQAFWNLRELLFAEQQEIVNRWNDRDLADAAKAAGASDEAVKAISEGKYKTEATDLAKANADTLQEQTGSVSSPRILQDGKEVSVPGNDLSQWINVVLAQQ